MLKSSRPVVRAMSVELIRKVAIFRAIIMFVFVEKNMKKTFKFNVYAPDASFI